MRTQLDLLEWNEAYDEYFGGREPRTLRRRRPPQLTPPTPPAVLSDASAYVRYHAELYRIARRSEAARRNDAKKLTLTELERAAMRHKADAHALVAEQALAALIRRTQP